MTVKVGREITRILLLLEGQAGLSYYSPIKLIQIQNHGNFQVNIEIIEDVLFEV